MQHSTGNRCDGFGLRGNQCSEPRDAMGKIAPHRGPRCDNRNVAALTSRPVSQARGGFFSSRSSERTDLVLSCVAIVLVLACALFDGPYWIGQLLLAWGLA